MTESVTPRPLVPSGPERPAFMSEADCRDLLARLVRFSRGGGYTTISVHSSWTGNVRWARNQVSSSGDVRSDLVQVVRNLNGADASLGGGVLLNEFSDAALMAAVRRAERMSQLHTERPQSELAARYPLEPLERQLPQLFSETTYQLDADRRAEAARQLAQSAQAAGMLSAGYIEVSAHSMAQLDSFGQVWYYPYTQAQYSVTVRDPQGTGSGWAGLDHYDWSKIAAPKLSQIALDKCLNSRNPVKIEPGHYTTILEPQAVCDIVGPFVQDAFDRPINENGAGRPFFKSPGNAETGAPGLTKLGDPVIDARLSLSVDVRDPELGIPPFDNTPFAAGGPLPFMRPVYHPVTWIRNGVLLNMAYDRWYGADVLGVDTGLPNPGAFRMSVIGTTTTIEGMIASTKRGLLVTRLDQVEELDPRSQLYHGQTRDGLWLIENGKIIKPVHNLVFTESVLFALNNVEQIGEPQRVFRPPVAALFPQLPHPAIVPALKIRDFSFTALDDAV